MELFNQWNRQDPVSSALQGRSVNIPVESSFDYAAPLQTPVTETIEKKDESVMAATPEAQSAPLAESEIVNMKDFSYEGYQVVRGEFFAHVYEPSITFNRNKITFNTSCLRIVVESFPCNSSTLSRNNFCLLDIVISLIPSNDCLVHLLIPTTVSLANAPYRNDFCFVDFKNTRIKSINTANIPNVITLSIIIR